MKIFTLSFIYKIIVLLLIYKLIKDYLYIITYTRKYEKYGIKSIFPIPIIGDIPYILLTGGINNSIERNRNCHIKYGNTFIIWLWMKPIMVTMDPLWFDYILLKKNYI